MSRLTDGEWKVLDALWDAPAQTLGQILDTLQPQTGWSRTTVHTYLTRMMGKDLVCHDASSPKRYSGNITREMAEREERKGLMTRFYNGSAQNLIASFVKEGTLSQNERAQLRKLLEDMEV